MARGVVDERAIREKRSRLGKVRVLLADRDNRTATLVHRILFTFGFRKIDVVIHGEEAVNMLRSRNYDLIVTEWHMEPIDGVTLVKAIRNAKEDKRIRRDIPIIMLTAQSESEKVKQARDAGISEFIVKPFSARTISDRIIQVIDNPRSFIEVAGYCGPCRRRKEKLPEGVQDRRVRNKGPNPAVRPANDDIQKQLGMHAAADIITDEIIGAAQAEIMKAEPEFVEWARSDIAQLQQAYSELKAHPGNAKARLKLLDTAYAIKAQAGTFGYDLGTEIAGMLVDYLMHHEDLYDEKLTVVRKHIDAIVVIFTEKIKDTGHAIGSDLIVSLRKLTAKLG